MSSIDLRNPGRHPPIWFPKPAWLRLSGLFAVALAGASGALAVGDKPGADNAKVSAALTPGGGRIVVEAQGLPPTVPLFFSAAVDQTVRLGRAEISGEMRLRLHVVQGRPEVLTLGLSGDGEVTDVAGKGLRDWSVRQNSGAAAGQRFLDLRPQLSAGIADPQDLDLVVHTRLPKPVIPGTIAVLLVTPGDAVGFASKASLQPDATVDLRVTAVSGLVPLLTDDNASRGPLQYFSTGEGRIEVRLAQRGALVADAELLGAQLNGTVNEAAGSVDFRLRAQLRAQKVGARLRVLGGRAALNDKTRAMAGTSN